MTTTAFAAIVRTIGERSQSIRRAAQRYADWLHTGWPAGLVEPGPVVQADGRTNVPGVYVAGDLAGVPLLKFAIDTGVRAVRAILAEPGFVPSGGSNALSGSSEEARGLGAREQPVDLVVVGAGVAGLAAAVEAKRQGLSVIVLETAEPLSTLVNFPARKPIFTYPTDLTPAGAVQVQATVKEDLVHELRQQMHEHHVQVRQGHAVGVVRGSGGSLEVELGAAPSPAEASAPLATPRGASVWAKRVIIAVGRSGDFRQLGVPGEDLPKVYNRLHDPRDFTGKRVLVVGGGDSAVEAAIALAQCKAHVTLSYRRTKLTRPKPENLQRLATLAAASDHLQLELGTHVESIDAETVSLRFDAKHGSSEAGLHSVSNDVVFVLIGREPPLDFLRRAGVGINGDWSWQRGAAFAAFLAFCIFMYLWKGGFALNRWFSEHKLFPFNMPDVFASGSAAVAAAAQDPSTMIGTLAISMSEPGFYYTLAYTTCVCVFGLRRIRKRNTPYITLQTSTLMAIQVLPLFLLPYILLPYAGGQGWFDSGSGWLGNVADALFPMVDYGHGREYWRAFGLILAWPLFIWNFFSEQPLWGWLVLGSLQTFVLIPLMVWKWGKGAYCGWICSCGALAETLGDEHRQKMPHGPLWNKLNMLGQVILAVVTLLLFMRVLSWVAPGTALGGWVRSLYYDLLSGWGMFSYYFLVDTLLAGIVGVGFYFWFSGRVWCRFACPLAALMHIYARFSRFRIIPEKAKCISCNVCTSVCHQGIDVMNFANKGEPMADPECVRCSACVQSCPTGVLQFGEVEPASGQVIRYDKLVASAVRAREAAPQAPL